jgi:hypothetical protein
MIIVIIEVDVVEICTSVGVGIVAAPRFNLVEMSTAVSVGILAGI